MSKVSAQVLIVLCLTLYACLLMFFSPFLFHDSVNHLTRAYIIAELLTQPDPPFAQLFRFEFVFAPYILGDVILAAIYCVLPFVFGGKIWLLLCCLLTPLAMLWYARVLGLKPHSQVIVVFVGCYLGTDWFFMAGFLNYRLAIPLVFFALGALELFLKDKRWLRYVAYLLCAIGSYLMHLSGLFYLGIIVGILMLFRLVINKVSIINAVFALLPLILLSLYHVLAPSPQILAEGALVFRDPLNKLLAIGIMFIRFSYGVDLLMFGGLMTLFVVLVPWSYWTKQLRGMPGVELLVVTVVLFVVYLVLPVQVKSIYDIDDRTLPFIFIFALFTSLIAFESRDPTSLVRRKASLLLAAGLALGNVAYLSSYMMKHQRRVVQYVEAVSNIPEGKTVFPITTIPDDGRIQMSLHLGILYTALRVGLTPYVFGREFGYAMYYFSYLRQPYNPSIFWYLRHQPIRWDLIEKEYDYIISTLPLDASRVPQEAWEKVFANAGAIVFRRKS